MRLLRDVSLDGRPMGAVRDALRGRAVPTFAVTGDADHIAPALACDISPHRGGDDHTWLRLERGPDVPRRFGHLDLVLGDDAPTLVYPRVGAFLLAHAARCEIAAP